MKIGFLQFSPALGDVNATIRSIDRLLKGMGHADVLVLPELCNSGYNFESFDQAWQTSERIKEGVFAQYLEAICARRKCFIVSGFNERYRERLYNSAILVGPEGFIGKYRKLHLFMREKDFFTPGDNEPIVFNVGKCKLGMLICFDWIFPEVWRILAIKGADLICHPSNLVLPGFAQRAIPIHALINRVFIVTANRIGSEGEMTFTGLSTIADPRGEVLAQASETEEKVGLAEMDPALARDKMVTARNHVIKDRRPDLYSLLTATGRRTKLQ